MTRVVPGKNWGMGLLGCLGGLLAGCDRSSDQAGAPATPAPASQAASVDPNCAASGDLSYICGLRNAEDLIRLPDSEWLIVSGLSAQGQGAASGHIYLVDHENKSYEEWFPGALLAIKADSEMFGACPGPINTANASPHGLAIREQAQDRYRLYMTSHGEREAIEIFDVDASGAKPTIAWAGCVVLPEKTFANSVAILADGGFVTTKMMDPTEPNGFGNIMAGKITGSVHEWHPGGQVTAVPGTELSGANGIELSPDQRWMFVTALGSREMVRFDRSVTPMAKQAVQLDVIPDNIRWTEDGKLYTTGGNYVPPAECAEPPCSTGWSVVAIDPESLQATRVTGMDQTAALQGVSTALQVGDEIWIGTYDGDRVGYMPKP